MSDLSRRLFIKQTSVAAATVGAASAVPAIAARASDALTVDRLAVAGHDTIFAHVKDVARGEIALLVGERQIIIRDRVLVRRLLKAAQD